MYSTKFIQPSKKQHTLTETQSLLKEQKQHLNKHRTPDQYKTILGDANNKEYLLKRYEMKYNSKYHSKKEDKRIMVHQKRVESRKKRKEFRAKRKECIYEAKADLIKKLYQIMGNMKQNCGIVPKRVFEALLESKGHDKSKYVDSWGSTKKMIFTGNPHESMLEKYDGEQWLPIYQKLTALNSACLVNLSSNDDYYNFVCNWKPTESSD